MDWWIEFLEMKMLMLFAKLEKFQSMLCFLYYPHFALLQTIIFFGIGGSWKSWGGPRIFPWKIGGHKNYQEIIGCLQILLNIFFNEKNWKMHIFHTTGLRYMFLEHCNSGWGRKIFHQIGGPTKILLRYFWKFMMPPIWKKKMAPLSMFLKGPLKVNEGVLDHHLKVVVHCSNHPHWQSHKFWCYCSKPSVSR